MWNPFHSILHIEESSKHAEPEEASTGEVLAYAWAPQPSRHFARARRTNPDALATLPSFMEVNFRPETESRSQERAWQTGPAPNDPIEDKQTQRNPWNT